MRGAGKPLEDVERLAGANSGFEASAGARLPVSYLHLSNGGTMVPII